MRLCRFNDDRLGLVRDDEVVDVSAALAALPAMRWPLMMGDWLLTNLPALAVAIPDIVDQGNCPAVPIAAARLNSLITSPSKILAAPGNYIDHLKEGAKDPTLGYGRTLPSIEKLGLFLKANSSLVGPSEGVRLRFPDRRNDFETELAIVVGRRCYQVKSVDAPAYIAGYMIGLDMSLRGEELESVRKSLDTYSVLGPWLVTSDEIADPNELDIKMSLNGSLLQNSNTRHMICGVHELVQLASSYYTLYPGDVIMTGTPAGVAPVKAGDVMVAEIGGIGTMQVAILND